MLNYPPESEASREVANLTERKNLRTPYMVSTNLFRPDLDSQIFNIKIATQTCTIMKFGPQISPLLN